MKFIFFLVGASALFTTTAIPMLPSGSLEAHSAPLDHNVPKIGIGHKAMTKNDRAATKAMMIDHYMALQPDNEQKKGRLAFAKERWHDGNGPDDKHRQYLDFDYHRGDTPNSEKIGQTVTIARDRPPPESHFAGTVPLGNKAELAKEMDKKYKNLPPDLAKHVRSMKAHMGWVEGTGLREESQMTYHYGYVPLAKNRLGDPVTIYRSLSFLIDDDVPPEEVPGIKKRIRQEHEKLDNNDPLKQANYGVVIRGWHGENPKKARRVGTTLFKVKDKLTTDSAEEDFKRIGDFHVTMRTPKTQSASSSSSSTKQTIR